MRALVQQCRAQHAALVLVTHSVLATGQADRVLQLSAGGMRPLQID
jgi:ABC-type lipoprotein export system ATPase subunit